MHDCDQCSKYFECNSYYKMNHEYKPIVKKIRQRMQKVCYKIAVMSGKGGVGKSTVSANLAITLAKKYRVGLVDFDFDGPSIPRLLQVKGKTMRVSDQGFDIYPVEAPSGVKVISTGLVYDEDRAVVWRGTRRQGATEQFLSQVDFGELDFLVMDLPPGTSSETVNILKYLPELSGIVIVTIPAELALDAARRGIRLCQQAKAPLLGIIENMSGVICPDCQTVIPAETSGGEKLAQITDVRLLGKVPYDLRVSDLADEGISFVESAKETLTAKAFAGIVAQIEGLLEEKDKKY
jgi:Mrp family chromosome partitioning ATPase